MTSKSNTSSLAVHKKQIFWIVVILSVALMLGGLLLRSSPTVPDAGDAHSEHGDESEHEDEGHSDEDAEAEAEAEAEGEGEGTIFDASVFPMQDLRYLQRNVRLLLTNGKTLKASPSAPSCSAVAGPLLSLWLTKRGTGSRGYFSVLSLHPKKLQPPPGRSASYDATQWPCCPSVAITWPTIGDTGSTSATRLEPNCQKFTTLTGFARTRAVISSGQVSAKTPVS